ncbi:TIGR02996 domain-containing protein [Gemmata massiliana]|nr:TIGR02996 domain-containing protein [Gemmata massiliana]
MSDGPQLLDAIRLHPLELTPRLAYHDWAKEHPDAVHAMIAAVMAVPEFQILTPHGLGLSRRSGETSAEREERLRNERILLLTERDGFSASVAWLATRGTQATVDAGRDSYGYKHDVECSLPGDHAVYVPNGAFIAAAVHAGFVWKTYWASPNVRFGISRRPLRARSRDEQRTSR